jgi:hypothetical protein
MADAEDMVAGFQEAEQERGWRRNRDALSAAGGGTLLEQGRIRGHASSF